MAKAVTGFVDYKGKFHEKESEADRVLLRDNLTDLLERDREMNMMNAKQVMQRLVRDPGTIALVRDFLDNAEQIAKEILEEVQREVES